MGITEKLDNKFLGKLINPIGLLAKPSLAQGKNRLTHPVQTLEPRRKLCKLWRVNWLCLSPIYLRRRE